MRICILAILALVGAAERIRAQDAAFEATQFEVDAFILADRDKDGLLSRAEFKTFVREMAKADQPTAKQIKMFGAYWLAFIITDKNKDGVVSPIELRSADDTHRAGEGPVPN